MGLKVLSPALLSKICNMFKSDQDGIERMFITCIDLVTIPRSNQTKMGLKVDSHEIEEIKWKLFKSDQDGIESMLDTSNSHRSNIRSNQTKMGLKEFFTIVFSIKLSATSSNQTKMGLKGILYTQY